MVLEAAQKHGDEGLDLLQIPSANAYRVGQSKFKKIQKLAADPLTASNRLMHITKYSNTIQDLGHEPFFAHYWSPKQTQIYNSTRRTNKFLRVSADATGSLVHTIARPGGGQSGHIFLYALVMRAITLFPICFMLSERHNANAIQFFAPRMASMWRRDAIRVCKRHVFRLTQCCRSSVREDAKH